MAYNETWLIDGTASRIVLAVISRYNVLNTTEETIYISNKGYMTTSADVFFTPIMSGGLEFNESISTTGGISTSYGDVEIINPNGEYDDWLDSTKFIWVNREIKLYYGDPKWAAIDKDDIPNVFQLIYNGLVEDIASRARDKLNIKVRDKMERLNYPVTENKLPAGYGTWSSTNPNTDSTLGVVLGEVHNITPLQINPATLEYFISGLDVSSSGMKELLEARDNGVPIHSTMMSPTISGVTLYTNNVSNGITVGGTSLTCNVPLVGTCTISVQGINEGINLTTGIKYPTPTYFNDVAHLVAYITSYAGHSTLRLNSQTEIDLNNFQNFYTANSQAVGIFINDNMTVLSACQALSSSLGAQIYFTRLGKLQLLQLGVYTSDTEITITDTDILYHSLYIAGRTEVQAATTIGYCKNWTVQKGLETGIPQEHKDMFAKDWLTYTIKDDTIKNTYKLTSDPVQKNTMLQSSSDAVLEATRLHNYYKQPHTIYSFVGTPRMQLLKLGQKVKLIHNRFGLDGAGKDAQVISLNPNWSTGFVKVGVIV